MHTLITRYTDTGQSPRMTIPHDEYDDSLDYWESIYPRCKTCHHNDITERMAGMHCRYPNNIAIKDGKCTNLTEVK